jgi:hypothetical protein
VLILVLNDFKRMLKWTVNRIRLWTMLGESDVQLTAAEIEKMRAFPPRESVEKAIIHSERKID